jgi:23S rRNA (guanine2445-N2)-methyltransferase / 23S rRNA (guanine2069-N7)-methyltransferase
LRESFGFSTWVNHDRKGWEKLLAEAKERHKLGAQNFTAPICGCDVDLEAVSIAEAHINNAGLEKVVKVTTGEVKYINPTEYHLEHPGIIVTNPPYGERLEDVESLHELYRDFGKALRENFLNWEVAMLAGNPDLGKNMGIRSYKSYNFFNGTIACKLLLFRISPEMFWREYKGEK